MGIKEALLLHDNYIAQTVITILFPLFSMGILKIRVDGACHYPGSDVRGEVLINVRGSKPKQCENIAISFMGGATVSWKRDGYAYTSKATYINSYAVIWIRECFPTGELPAGEHRFPFEFHLPLNCPPSFLGTWGGINYEIEAKMTQSGWSKILGNHAVTAPISVKPGPEILRFYQEPKIAETIKNVGFFCFNSGSITCAVTLLHTGFSAGQHIPINVHINNQTSRKLRIHAALRRQDIFISSGLQNIVCKTVAWTWGPRIEAREAVLCENIVLKIPKGIYPTIRNCACISVEYELVIKIKIPWSCNKTLQMPIVIASKALPSAPPVPPQQTLSILQFRGATRRSNSQYDVDSLNSRDGSPEKLLVENWL